MVLRWSQQASSPCGWRIANQPRNPLRLSRVVLQLQGCDVRMDHLWQAPYRVPHHAQRQSVQMAPVRTRPHPPVRSVVPAVCLKLSRSRGHDARAGPVCRPYDDLSMGAALCARDRQTVSAIPEAHQRLVSDRRDVRACRRGPGRISTVASIPTAIPWISCCRATRDRKAAIAFFRKTLGAAHTTPPRVVTVDKNPAYPVAFEAVRHEGLVRPRSNLRQCKYLNNIIEQDHRFIKRRTRPMLGFKRFTTAWRTFAGLRDRALVSVMLYSVARVSAVIGMRRQGLLPAGAPGVAQAPREGRPASRRPGPPSGGRGAGRLPRAGRARRGDGGALSERRPRGAAADGPGALAASRPGDDQAAGGGGGSPALDLLPHVPGDGDHGVSVEWGDARTRAADRRARLPEDDEALRPDGGHDHRRRDRAHRDLVSRTRGSRHHLLAVVDRGRA